MQSYQLYLIVVICNMFYREKFTTNYIFKCIPFLIEKALFVQQNLYTLMINRSI